MKASSVRWCRNGQAWRAATSRSAAATRACRREGAGMRGGSEAMVRQTYRPRRPGGRRRRSAPPPLCSRRVRILLLVVGALGLLAGWNLFYFQTDDAYIAFRYVANAHVGRGLVWNPAPFLPVEGYTSFLWVMILRAVWALTGIEPPDSSNWISLAFGAGSLWLAYRF